jgi:ankyrin repeat protein
MRKLSFLLFSLIAYLFLSIIHSSHAMEVVQKKNSEPSRATLEFIDGINKQDRKKIKKSFRDGADVNFIEEGKPIFYRMYNSYDYNYILPLIIAHPNIDLMARDPFGNIALHRTCELGLTTIVDTMLTKKPQLAIVRNREGNTPLHIASGYGHKDCIGSLLLHNKRTINRQNYSGETALHIACANKNFDVIKELIINGANTTIKNDWQQTPLLILFCSIVGSDDDYDSDGSDDKWDLFNSFIDSNSIVANKLIHAIDKHKNCQFHLCATVQGITYYRFNRYLHFLISHGLNICARNNDGKRALDIACKKYNELYNFYIKNKMLDIWKILINQERKMHTFLRLTSPNKQCVLFIHLLQQFSADGIPLPKDLLAYIALIYYALNIETIIAKKYNDDNQELEHCEDYMMDRIRRSDNSGYYCNFIENKNRIKHKLLIKPKLKLLW